MEHADLVAAGQEAVAMGEAESFSAWVNDALRRQVDHARRLRALDEFLAEYEQEHGVITAAEIREAERSARARAVVVRGNAEGGAGGQVGQVGQGAA